MSRTRIRIFIRSNPTQKERVVYEELFKELDGIISQEGIIQCDNEDLQHVITVLQKYTGHIKYKCEF